MTTEINQTHCYHLYWKKTFMMGNHNQVQGLHDAHQC